MTPRKLALLLILVAFSILTAAHSCPARQPAFTPYKASGIYDLGETVGWTITRPQGSSGEYSYEARKNNQDVIKSGKLDFSAGTATIEVTLNEPAMVYVEVTPPDGGKSIALGAAVAPEKLQPSIPRPEDFDAFWKSKIGMLRKTPPRAGLRSTSSPTTCCRTSRSRTTTRCQTS
jgi:hypothetical protein